MTPTEAAVYASERALLLRALVVLAIMGVSAGLLFAMLFGTVNPRLRRMIRRSKRQVETINGLKLEHVNLTLQNAQLARQLEAAEKALFEAKMALGAAELESRRNHAIRLKTEDALIRYRKEIGR